MADTEVPLVPEAKLAEAQALWEFALFYVALAAAARTMQGAGAAGSAAASGLRASQLLARAYYRLIRGAWTGYTIADRGDEEGDSTSLRELYSDFETLAYRAIPESRHDDIRKRVRIAGSNYEDAKSDLEDERDVNLESDEPRYSDDPDLVEAGEEFSPEDGDDYAADLTDDRDWPDSEDIAIERLEAAEKHLADVEAAEKEELKKLDDRIKAIDKEMRAEARKKAKAAQAKRLKAAQARGKRAAAAMKAAQAGARNEIVSLQTRDDRALGFVSVPHSPQPCAWCLLLASRGTWFYSQAFASGTSSEIWHENCNCSLEPIFNRDYYFSSPTFEKNRAARAIWDKTAKGRGKSSLKVWRSEIRKLYKGGASFEENIRSYRSGKN